MPSRHRSAWRRRQDSRARRRTAVTIAIPVALAAAVGGIVVATGGLSTHVSNSSLASNCFSQAAYVQPAAAAHHGHGTGGTQSPPTGQASTTTGTGTTGNTGTGATGTATPTDAGTGTAGATPTATGTGGTATPTVTTGTSTAASGTTGTATPTSTATGTTTTGTTGATPTASATPCPSATATTTTTAAAGGAAAAANVNCSIIVPADPLSAQGLATPYQLTGSNGMTPAQSGCTMTNAANLGAFVQATIIDPATGALSVYDPLVITQGTTPLAAPVVPTLPANAVVTIDFGFNGTDLTQVGATANALQQGNCVNGADGADFGQVSFCNGTNFFNTAFQLEQQGKLTVPSAGTSAKIVASGGNLGTGQNCPTTRNFDMIDQDQSDNVTSQYLLNPATGQTAQNTTANAGNLQGTTLLTNGSDDALLAFFLDPTLGCTPFMAPDLGNNNQMSTSQALNELSAAKNQTAITALVPENDEMTLTNGAFDANKTNLYRSEVGQAPISAQNDQQDSPAMYCQNMVNIQTPFLQANQALLATGQSPVPTVGNNLLNFLANRLSMSFTNLNCGNFGLTNPITVTLDGNGAAVAATFNTTQQTVTNTTGTATGTGTATATATPTTGATTPTTGATPTTAPTTGTIRPNRGHRGRNHHQVMNPSGM